MMPRRASARLLRSLLPNILALALAVAPSTAMAQAVPLQAGATTPGHVPMYSGSGGLLGQPVIQDSGPASGGQAGLGLNELLLQQRGFGAPPYANAGSGPLGTNFCNYDGPITGPYHFLCLGPNSHGGGMIAYGAGNGATPQPLKMNLNGTDYQFPFSIGGIVGPPSTNPGTSPVWANSTGTLLSSVPGTVNVGAICPGGTADDALCLRSMGFLSNTNYVFPVGSTYNLCSAVAPFDYPVTDPHSIVMRGLTNIHVIATGATFKGCPGSAGNPFGAILIAESQHWTWDGGTCIGNRSGLAAGDENVCVTLLNDVDFRLRLERETGFGGNGAAVAGDWNAYFDLDLGDVDGVGHIMDTAFLYEGTIHFRRAVGADTNGNTGPGQVGQNGFSDIHDIPMAGYNRTGIAYTQTQRVTLLGSDISNFNTCVYLASGVGLTFLNNNVHDCPGSGNSPGLGYLIGYVNDGGITSSVGFPPGDIRIIGGSVQHNGAVVGGPGIKIAGNAITNGSTPNSDVISGVMVDGVTLDSNNNVGIDTDGSAQIVGLSIGPSNVYKGTVQTKGVGTNALARLTPLQAAMAVAQPAVALDLAQRPSTSGIGIALANTDALAIKNAAGSAVPVFGLSSSDVAYVKPGNANAYGQLQGYAGNPFLQWGAGGLQSLTAFGDLAVPFSQLPTTNKIKGQHLFCTDCRNTGEAAGAGSGTLVYVNSQGTWTTIGSATPAAN